MENGAFWRRNLPTSPCFRSSPAAYTEIRPTAAPLAMRRTLERFSIPVVGHEKCIDALVNPIRWTFALSLICPSITVSRSRLRASGHRICKPIDEPADLASGRLLRWPNPPTMASGNETFSLCCLFSASSVHLVSPLELYRHAEPWLTE